MPTRWAADIDPANVLPEHPRPQLVRPQWRNLNGIYECAIRPAAEAKPRHFDLRILVPFAVESSLSGIGRDISSAERIWYRRCFSAPAAPPGRTWILHFGAVDWRADVWLDGVALGSHEGGYEPFSFDVGVLGAAHELVVAVWDPTDDGPQPRGKQARHPGRLTRPIFYTPASGIWQTVWLEQVPCTYVRDLHLTPRGDCLRLAVQLAGAAGGERLQATAFAGDVPIAAAAADAGEPLVLQLPGARRWSPEDPYLHKLELQISRDGELIDTVQSYFGLRDVSMARDAHGLLRIHLNGEPIFAHGLLDQGYWPDGIYTAPTDAALRFDVEQTKRLGYNLIRKHVKVEPARWYWHCDSVGLLVCQDIPNGDRMTLGLPLSAIGWVDVKPWVGARGIRRSAQSAAIFERELTGILATLRNHPSVVMWVVFNEGWGQFDTARIAALVHAGDPSRLLDAASGWVDSGAGDVRDLHVYYPGPRLPSRRDAQRADMLGEWGGFGLRIKKHLWPKPPFAYRKRTSEAALEQSYAKDLAALHSLIERGLAAAVYTQTTDVEGEINGWFTYDRVVLKVAAERLAQLNHDLLRRAAQSLRSAK